MIIEKKYFNLGILLFLSILIITTTLAYGVGCAYGDKNPLTINAGQTVNVNFNLQNMGGSENVTARPKIIKGSEIMKLTDSSDFLVPINGQANIGATVTVPATAEIGDIYPIEIEFTTVKKSESGSLSMGMSVGRAFNVIIVPTTEQAEEIKASELRMKQIINYIILGIIILISIIIIIIILKKKKKRKKK